ncbi:type VI secretion system-associated protein TagF [Elioraea sp.]|uniref:type VI secretion system-associated protein TagF n=1 Tax=Elioraea sp. TaxID=2185103 RepID=UPI0025B969CF|nr:type VI secretion system-associated protein TagF [Elioraea sp.]
MPDAAALSPVAVRQGYFGKLPRHGDFVRAGLPEEIVAGFDAWLRAGLAESRAMLGESWLDAFLEAPVWRFRFGPGLLGAPGLAGVMAPSVDRAGRYFPLMLGAAMPAPPAPDAAHAWFTALADAAADAVAEDWPQQRLADALASAGDAPAGGAEGGAVFATAGAPRVAACTRHFAALPPPATFAALLDDGVLP